MSPVTMIPVGAMRVADITRTARRAWLRVRWFSRATITSTSAALREQRGVGVYEQRRRVEHDDVVLLLGMLQEAVHLPGAEQRCRVEERAAVGQQGE